MQNAMQTRLDCEVALCGESGIEFCGTLYKPSNTLAFFTFEVAHCFPAVFTTAGQGIMPSVLAKSFKSLTLTCVNSEHQIAAYHPDTPGMADNIIGSVLAVELAKPGAGL